MKMKTLPFLGILAFAAFVGLTSTPNAQALLNARSCGCPTRYWDSSMEGPYHYIGIIDYALPPAPATCESLNGYHWLMVDGSEKIGELVNCKPSTENVTIGVKIIDAPLPSK